MSITFTCLDPYKDIVVSRAHFHVPSLSPFSNLSILISVVVQPLNVTKISKLLDYTDTPLPVSCLYVHNTWVTMLLLGECSLLIIYSCWQYFFVVVLSNFLYKPFP